MPKVSNRYLEVHPYKIIEKGFHQDRSQVSESLFSQGNEYHGIRGMFDEDYSSKTLRGSYFNGIYEYALEDTNNAYKGIIKRTHFMINSVDWVKIKLVVNNDEILDLSKVKFHDFVRELNMQNALYTRSFVFDSKYGEIRLNFKRLLNMKDVHEAIQEIELESKTSVNIHLEFILTSDVVHWGKDCYWNREDEFFDDFKSGICVKTLTTEQKLCSQMHIDSKLIPSKKEKMDKTIKIHYDFVLNGKETFTRYVINLIDKYNKSTFENMKEQAEKELKVLVDKGLDSVIKANEKFFDEFYEDVDIEIENDPLNQQGIRYCLFQLAQTYHGYEEDNNIGAKGLTGEAYSGHAFWDSETYCLPFYLFSNQKAAKNLLMFRYNTLDYARARAKELDCVGACFPIATRNGKEACNLWQHASLQFQPSTGVAYAIYHYMNIYNDEEFMQNYGLEMLIEISKFLLSRGDYNASKDKFGFYGVMGPDEFQMMVNHNAYTNFMAKKTFDYLIKLYESNKYRYDELFKKCEIDQDFIKKIQDASAKMYIIYDDRTKLFEQHDGYFDLPHVDINKIPTSDFPLYAHWSYDHIYRNDMIKQPDVLMFLFLYSQDFSLEQKKANYEFYEPRCIHESSLSPSIHSIFASELNKLDDAKRFFEFATRLDLDDYNCNTCEGIHTTSIAAAFMNIVYGFGGVKSDREVLKIAPIILNEWKSYTFRLKYKGAKLKIKVSQEQVEIINTGEEVSLIVYNQKLDVKDHLVIERKKNYVEVN